MKFQELVNEITKIGYEWHKETITANSKANAPHIRKTIREVEKDPRPSLIVSAGPSLYRQNILKRVHTAKFAGTIIATDGAYIQCLKAGIVPDWVITLDPHPTRIVRWFGDPDFEKNSEGDNYFERQDLDITFRNNIASENKKNMALVDKHGTKLAICSTAPANVVARTEAFDRYWFAPLVDDPRNAGITHDICDYTKLPALNTGGTVGTAGFIFAHDRLLSTSIAVVGMDFGYAMDTPFDKTQSFNMLKDYPNRAELYPHFTGFWGEAYTDPTYWWYRENFLDLLKTANARVINCSGEGLLFGERVGCMELEQWLGYVVSS